jgi:hypothetical protein
MDDNSEDETILNKKENPIEITKRQLIFLSISDFLIIVVIVLDLLYISELVPISPGDMMMINIVTVSISFVGYQIKRRLRKINLRKRRELESTSQESQH